MYYLMENKSIYYDGNKKIRSATYDFLKKEMSINGGKWKKWIKSSENIYDLIEVGDLVDLSWFSKTFNKQINHIAKVTKLSDNKDIFYVGNGELDWRFEEINIIYKRNKNGDYIQVWVKEK